MLRRAGGCPLWGRRPRHNPTFRQVTMGSRYLRTRWARLKNGKFWRQQKIPSWRWQRLEPIQEYEPKITVPGQQTTRVRLSQAHGASMGVKLDSRTNCSISQQLHVSHVLGQNWVSGIVFTWVLHKQDMKKRKLAGSWKVKSREEIVWST